MKNEQYFKLLPIERQLRSAIDSNYARLSATEFAVFLQGNFRNGADAQRAELQRLQAEGSQKDWKGIFRLSELVYRKVGTQA